MNFSIPIEHPHVDSVSARWQEPDTAPRDSAFLLAHGSGSHMDSPWLAGIAEGLLALGFPVMRFNYAYRERALREGRQLFPDRRPILEAVHELARLEFERRAGGRRLILAGKSLGARMSSHLAAFDAPAAALCFFGYPLHPPKKKESIRDEHFATIVQPALFLQGTRDEFCDLDLLRNSLTKYGGHSTLHIEDDADHGFHVRRSSGRTDDEVVASLLDRVDRWEREAFPPL